jgi:predicted aspartyl protease
MMHAAGFYIENNPCVKVHVCGSKYDPPGLACTAVIASGFTGFLLLPMRIGFEVGLKRRGAIACELANGTLMDCLTASGTVTFAGKTVRNGIILLAEDARDILLGTVFLRLFGAKVVIGASTVDIYDKDWLERVLGRTSEGTGE